MKYVLDSSVALKWVIAEADSGRAVILRDEYRLFRCHPELFWLVKRTLDDPG